MPRLHQALSFLVLLSLALGGRGPQLASATAAGAQLFLINEVDADTPGTDSAEFLELYDGGPGERSLDGLVLVFYNGASDTSYQAFDLDGYSTDANGYFVLCGQAANVPNCDWDVTPDTDLIQNGADAVALYSGNAADFPTGTPVTTLNLIDAIVYDTNDADDPGLLVLLNAGQPQVNEGGGGNSAADSNQRCPNGSGGLRNTSAYIQGVPSPGVENCQTIEPGDCGDPATPIHTIQGTTPVSPEVVNLHVIEGVVVGDFQDTSTGLSGFFVQEEDEQADGDPLTSEGIFVYDNGFGVEVAEGDVVRAAGGVAERYGMTSLSNISSVEVCSSGATVTPAAVSLPVTSLDLWETWEGMLVQLEQALFLTENYTLGQYGEIEVAVGGQLYQPTHLAEPGAAALAIQDLHDRSRIQIDDGSLVANPLPLPPFLGANNTLRLGSEIDGVLGVLAYNFGEYEIHPTAALAITEAARPPAPADYPGDLKVASFNVLNFFTTLDTGALICGPSGGLACRGADSASEFTRQRDKLLSALSTLDADVVGLIEIENNATAAVSSLVDGLNALLGAGTYAYIDTGTIGADAIKVALIYQPAQVTPVGAYSILDSTDDPDFIDTKNRPVLAQTFQAVSSGERFTVAVNHLKSKGSACDDVGDPDLGDGQGNCNLTRTKAATALAGWLASDPTGSGDPDFLIIGDLNAYAQEDPIEALKAAGYTNLIESFIGALAHSYTFEGQTGYLDHALATLSLFRQVRSVAHWHINSDEPHALDYNDYNQPLLYNADPYRSSDHDPVIIYLSLGGRDLNFLPWVRR